MHRLPEHLWEQAYPVWLQKATEYFILYVPEQDPWEAALETFYRGLQDSERLGDLEPAHKVLSQWLEQGTPFWRYERPLALITLVGTLLRLLGFVFLDLAQDAETREALVRWWAQAFALLQWTVERDLEHRYHEMEEERSRLERLENLKSGFVVVVAHELRTPLTILDGHVQLMEQLLHQPQVKTEELKPLLRGFKQGLHRLRMLIEAVLDLAAVERGQVARRPQPIWLDRLIFQVVEDVQERARERRIRVRMEPNPPPKARVLGDPHYLTKALYHLLDNALKFTREQGRITVRLFPLPEEREVEIQVEDTGVGIPKEAQEAIFERFVRLGNPNTYTSDRTQFKGGGAGLGLALVKGIVEAHGGRVWVESPGYDEEHLPGSTFFIRLPLATEDEIRAAVEAHIQEESQ